MCITPGAYFSHSQLHFNRLKKRKGIFLKINQHNFSNIFIYLETILKCKLYTHAKNSRSLQQEKNKKRLILIVLVRFSQLLMHRLCFLCIRGIISTGNVLTQNAARLNYTSTVYKSSLNDDKWFFKSFYSNFNKLSLYQWMCETLFNSATLEKNHLM